jgi:O-antigen/teichoic acid export membrane protein
VTEEDGYTEQQDVLALPSAGHVAIRGGLVSVTGYGVSTVLGTAMSILLLRYLGVDDYGRYATAIAIVGLAQGLADCGVSVVGQRGYAATRDGKERRTLLSDLIGIRLFLTPIAVALGVGFAAVVGYGGIIVAGVAVGGIGALVGLLTQTTLIPATAALRFTAITGVGLMRDISNAAFLLALVVVGAGLLPFLAVPTLAALVAFAATILFAGRQAVRARFCWAEWRPILTQALPIGVAAIISVLYFRALLIVTSLTASGVSTGLYAMSDRVVQVVVGGAAVMFSVSFPIVSRAGAGDDEARLVNAQQQLFDVAVFAAIFCVLVLSIAATPIVLLLGGDKYARSVPLLQIQSFALFGSFLSMVWLPALVAVHKQRSLIISSLAGLLTIIIIGGVLIPTFGITGTAITAALGEAAIAGAGLVALVRARPSLRPRLRAAGKLLAAGVVSATVALVPGLPAAIAAVVAAGVFLVLAWVTGSVPRDPVDAVLALRSRGT